MRGWQCYLFDFNLYNPHNDAASSKFGHCGSGPDFCAPDVCASGCERKSECDPGFGSQWAEKSKCPLNVCCSKFGFCGTTKDFCGDRKVKKETCDEDGTLNRVVGYYEGWGARRSCNAFFPEQIPRGVYSIINFAFATIDPQTFEVLPATPDDIPLYKRLTALKKDDPTLRVYIAIGGWTFNDPGPTATTFSDIARSEENQKRFIKSLIAFLNTYDMDGVDLDWEYPEAPDRSGRPEDFENFPKFMDNLHKALKQTAGRGGLSITLPASYWYLQHFDLVKLKKSVDFFNIMSYDLHGTWDKGNQWTGEYLNPHTNITEIDAALDLLWRNEVDQSMVVLGLAFYARAYTLKDPNCIEPQCQFASGAKKGPCSNEAGILLNSEIDNIVKEKGLEPKSWEKETVKMLHWDDQWLTYDDADTLKMKAKFARKLCLGGVMVWAISHDTKDAKYTKALAAAANRKILLLPSTQGPEEEVKIPHPQCKWTNCLDGGCPSDWQLMKRSDEHARDGEWMFDNSGCDGAGIHRLCCPSSEKLPTCGWYTLPKRGGKCNSACPTGMQEVGSNSNYCDSSYQAACCTTSDSDGKQLRTMELYEACEWAEAPMCDNGMCTFAGSAWPTELVVSSTGSGGAICNMRAANPYKGIWEVQERKYCCDTKKDNRKWSNCKWEKSVGIAAAGARCYSSCPGGKTRVAMDAWGDGCLNSGARAYCCDADSYDTEKRWSDEIQKYRDAMEAWVKSPTCPRGTGSLARRYLQDRGLISREDMSHLLTRQQTPIGGDGMTNAERVLALLILILSAIYQTPTDMTKAYGSAWDDFIKEKHSGMQTVPLKSFLGDKSRYPAFDLEGPEITAERFSCQLDVTDALIRRSQVTVVLCDADMCGIDGLCFDSFDEDAPGSSDKRGMGFGSLMARGGGHDMSPVKPRGALEKRENMDIEFECVDSANPNGKKIKWTKRPWISAGQWPSTDAIYDNALTHMFEEHCSMTNLRVSQLPDGEYYATEHIIEMQTMSLFFAAAPSDSRCNVPCEFFINGFMSPIASGPSMPGGFMSPVPSERIMDALGSELNTQNFVLLRTNLNGMKARIWRYADPISSGSWLLMLADSNPREALQSIRDAITVFNYLNHSYVRPKLRGINRVLREEFQRASDAYNFGHPNARVNLRDCWDEWFKEHLEDMVSNTRAWVRDAISAMRRAWSPLNNPNDEDYQARALQVNQHLDRLEKLGITDGQISIDTTNLW
ncbi:Killer toxin subunits alpha/beta 4 [Colletotrichum chlorophyti]|uniref:chitinase n=1 Tax=Colletotrichum chlorophyti TaxID=708187 RepID=A0A1Q8RL21_9PEZI|nr:Killer toxin subunits alpha/beta 4 [Colletotrichum chlorophyti]